MTDSGETSSPNPFDAEALKALSYADLANELIGDAHWAASLLEGNERRQIDALLFDICWVPNEQELIEIEERKAVWTERINQVLGELATEVFASVTGEELDPEEAQAALYRRKNSRALEQIGRNKGILEKGLESGRDDDYVHWVEGSTAHYLLEICSAQAEVGLLFEGDYVRETALQHLEFPGHLGVVLLNNALIGDTESYQPGIDAMLNGIEEENIDWGYASRGFDVVMNLLEISDESRQVVLKDLLIDIIARLRKWSTITSIPSYTTGYATMAAQAGVMFRERAYH